MKMVAVRSDTGTEREKDIETFLFNYLAELPRLQKENTYGRCPIQGDPYGRAVVWGLIKNEGADTVVLLNHHDAVDIEDYGAFKSYACDPFQLRDHLKILEHNVEVKRDLEDDNWIFGRGTADMKGGAAIQLNLMKRYCEKKDFKGNLLFLSVPDEETLSAGMRRGVGFMAELKKRYGLNYRLLINSEPHERQDGRPLIYDGSVGKIMAVICIRGKKTHIGNIFEGLNPAFVLSTIVTKTEVNTEFSDEDLGERSAPPAWSCVKDFKESYDASVPEYAGGYLSFLTLQKTPEEILEKLKEVCEEAFRDTVDRLRREYKKLYGEGDNIPHFEARIKFYEELLKDAMKEDRQAAEAILESSYSEVLRKMKNGEANVPESNFKMIIELMKIARYNKPVAVIALSPPYYPCISSQRNSDWPRLWVQLQGVLSGPDLFMKHYFMGISDNSYADLQQEADVSCVSANMPLWREGLYTLPFEEMKQLSVPTLIVGPWGKDLHKITERVYLPDLIENTPMMIERIIGELFAVS